MEEINFFNGKQSSQGKKVHRILGLDPGLANTGFGIIDFCNNKYNLVSYGTIETKSEWAHQKRLFTIYEKLNQIVKEFNPSESAMESLFFARNVTSALFVAEAKGVISLCMSLNKISLTEYKPNQIKQAVTGTTQADKKLVQKYVKMLLNLEEEPKPDHAADALACAITHINYTLGQGGFSV